MKKTKKKQTYIYGLADPNDFTIRYIGQSVNPLARVNGHISECYTDNKKTTWLKKLKDNGVKPYIIIFEKCDIKIGHIKETEYIERYKKTIYNHFMSVGCSITVKFEV